MIEINNIMDVEKHIEDIDAVIFDLDDTLYSEKDYVISGFRAIADNFPQIKKLAEKLWSVFEYGGKPIDEVFKSEGIFELKNEALKIYQFHYPDITLYHGVKEMISNIKNSGKKIGIITDGRPEGQRAKISALGLRADYVIITDELGGIEYRKPNKTAFQLMQQHFCVPFEKMVYVGDNIGKDFIAPLELGMKQIYFKNSNGLYYNKLLK